MRVTNHTIKNPAKRRVFWGKYAGTKFEDVPTEYLEWFVKSAYQQMRNRKQWAIEELKRRNELTPPNTSS